MSARGACMGALVAFGAISACSDPGDSAEIGQRARDVLSTVSVESDAAGITSALFASIGRQVVIATVPPAASGDLKTAAFGDGAKLSFLPRGCLTTIQDEAKRTVTYTFANCIYLRSIRVHGVLTLGYAAAEGGYNLTLRSPELKLGASTSALDGTAEVRSEGAGRLRVALNAELRGESKRGSFRRTLARNVSWTIGTACFDIDGASEGTIGDRSVTVNIGPFRRCRSECPEEDSEIRVTDGNRSYRIAYDGTDTAVLREAGETDRPLSLACAK